jgi:hypothetical protein
VEQKIPKALLERIRKIKAKRARTVLDHIVSHGFITTEELKMKYGYDHPPRAARDVRELGISLETFRVEAKNGRMIAGYRFDLKTALDIGKTGRRQFPKELKKALLEKFGARCTICGGSFNSTFLQVDHRVPFEVAGETEAEDPDAFMLVCASCNRTKSWSCEHCENWSQLKEAAVCKSCYWANPTAYSHVAMAEVRRADVTWLREEAQLFDRFRDLCKKSGQSIQDGIKKAVERSLK